MWKKLSDLHFNIVNHQTIVIDHCVYIIGGYKNTINENSEKISVFAMSKDENCTKISPSRTFSWNCRTNEFVDLTNVSNEPLDCYGHTVVNWQKMGILFGGHHTGAHLDYASPTVYLFVPNNNCLPKSINFPPNLPVTSNYWIAVSEVEGAPPVERDGHSSVAWYDNLFVFGGLLGTENKYFDNKLYQLSLTSWQWTIIYNGNYIEPLGRDFCTMVAYGNALYIFGGRSDDGFNEIKNINIYDTAVWKFELNSNRQNRWIKFHPGYGIIYNSFWMTTSNDTCESQSYISKYSKYPFPRRSHMAVLSQKEIIIFGGLYETDSFCVHFNDLWSFNIDTCQWSLLSKKTFSSFELKDPPNLRRGSLTRINDNYALLIGGVTTSFNDSNISDGKMIGNNVIIPSDTKLCQYPDTVAGLCASRQYNFLPIILYQKPHTTFSGSITMINDLTLRSVSHVYLLQPQLSLYQMSLHVATSNYSLRQLKSCLFPHSVISDIETLLIFNKW